MKKRYITLLNAVVMILIITSGVFSQVSYKVSEYDLKIRERIIDILKYTNGNLYVETMDSTKGLNVWKINLNTGDSDLVLKSKAICYELVDTRIFYAITNDTGKNYTVAFFDLVKEKEYVLDRSSEGTMKVSPDGNWVGYPYERGYKILNLSNSQAFTFSGLWFEIFWANADTKIARLYDETHLEIVDLFQRSLAVYHAPEGYVIKNYNWSPDGRRLALIVQAMNSTKSELVVIDRNGSVEMTYQWEDLIDCPIWSPDGKKLEIFVRKDWLFDIVILNMSGEVIRKIGGVALDPIVFSWAPNSNDFAYSKDIDGAMTQLWFGSITSESDISPPLSRQIYKWDMACLWSQDSKSFFIGVNYFMGVNDTSKIYEITR